VGRGDELRFRFNNVWKLVQSAVGNYDAAVKGAGTSQAAYQHIQPVREMIDGINSAQLAATQEGGGGESGRSGKMRAHCRAKRSAHRALRRAGCEWPLVNEKSGGGECTTQ